MGRDKAEIMQHIRSKFESDLFAKHAGIELLTLSPGHAKAQMKLHPYHLNGVGTVQGGAIFTLADFAFAVAANAHGTVAVAVNVSITFMKAVTSGVLTAEAHEVALNPRLGTYTVEVKDEPGNLIAVFQGLAYRKNEPLIKP